MCNFNPFFCHLFNYSLKIYIVSSIFQAHYHQFLILSIVWTLLYNISLLPCSLGSSIFYPSIKRKKIQLIFWKRSIQTFHQFNNNTNFQRSINSILKLALLIFTRSSIFHSIFSKKLFLSYFYKTSYDLLIIFHSISPSIFPSINRWKESKVSIDLPGIRKTKRGVV